MKKVIITGASGFIGNILMKKLLDNNVEVWVITRNTERFANEKNNNLHIIKATYEEYENIPNIIKDRNFDAFFHFAWDGVASNRDNYKVQIPNIYYSCVAAEIAVKMGVKKFVYADSCHEYLVSKNSDGIEFDYSIYGPAKMCAQKMCKTIAQKNDMDFIGVLFVNVFGIGDYSTRSVNTLLTKIINNQDLDLIDGNNLYDWTYIDDCVEGIIMAAEKGINGKIYCISNELRPFKDILNDVREALKTNVNFNFGKFKEDSYVDFSKIDFKALEKDTGYKLHSDFKEDVIKTYDWLKSQKK